MSMGEVSMQSQQDVRSHSWGGPECIKGSV